MKRLLNASIWTQLATLAAIIATLTTLWANAGALADASPFVFKYQLAGIVDTLTDIQYRALRKELNDLRQYRLMLKESIERETDPDDKREKTLRLESIEGDITTGDSDYKVLRCKVERVGC